MVALRIADVKNFMSLLFAGVAFDNFLFVEGDVSTAIDYHIEGKVNMNFYTDEELEELKVEEYQTWGATKAIVTQMIKGKRLPVSMKLVLKKAGSGDLTYLLNIRFDSNALIVVTGTTRAVFTLDKTGESEWDENMKGFLKRNGIEFEVM